MINCVINIAVVVYVVTVIVLVVEIYLFDEDDNDDDIVFMTRTIKWCCLSVCACRFAVLSYSRSQRLLCNER